ncbi:MAG: hypothetical protein EOP45_17830 [Sphingobacteriaceae bacterium]|nr:MAG: hypothetical protein EOP45_17830 [Sphingobacteriaceae bacterium]
MLKNLSLSVKYQYLIFGIPLLLLYLCLYACNGSDYNEELSGNYFYTDEGDNAKDIINHLPNRKGIYAKVTAYDYNTDFIVAVQQPDYEKHKSMIAYKLRNDLKKYAANSSADRLESEQEADSILRHDPYYKLIFAEG